MMQVKTMAFRDGSRLPRKRARKIGLYLGQLERKQGRLNAHVVVDDARKHSSPLHSLFVWDNTRAAELYRLEQARHLLRSVTVVYRDITPKHRHPEIRAFVHMESLHHMGGNADAGYITTSRAMQDKTYRAEIVARALREAKAWRDKYALYDELATIVAAIDGLTGDEAA